MDIERRIRKWKGIYYMFCALCLCLLIVHFYLLHREHGLHFSEMFIPILFFLLMILAGWVTLKYRNREFSHRFVDHVTGGPNELMFQEIFEKRAGEPGEKYAFLYIGIKQFSLINSKYGWETGNRILREVYTALKGRLREGEMIARISSDIYYLLLQTENEESLCARIYDLDDSVYDLEPSDLKIEKKLFLSIGAYILKDDSDTYANAVDCADFCRTQSTDASDGNTHFEVYNYSLMDTRKRARKLTRMAQPALDQKHFKMYLQPKYELVHETLAGAEALIRWIDPEEGMVSLGEFIPLFERNGFMRQIDYFIFETALEQIEAWIADGIEPVPISVNLSKSHFTGMAGKDFFEKQFIPIYERHPVPKKYVEFEISESTMLDSAGSLIELVHLLQAQGFECSMDDFGSGYSSLNTLKSLPVNTVKLDQKMFSEEEKEKGKIVSRGIIRIARELNMKVVAEGVETREYVDFLKEQKCDMIQGYYFGRPMPVQEFDALMKQRG